MAKRISKKLLMGLGSAITFGAVGTVSGFGVKSIIDSVNEKNLLNNQINKLAEANFDQAPDYNKATREMFFDTTNLKSFHFGNVQRGQTITPYGWLGVFEPGGGIARKIALTGWNGEILWVNDDYVNEGNKTEFNVYDMKYDFNTDLVFVARTNSDNGLFNSGGAVSVIIDILDAQTGLKRNTTNINQTSAWGYLSGNFIDSRNNDHVAISKNLYSLDVVSRPGTNDVLVTWTPNFLQLTQRKDNSTSDALGNRWENGKNKVMTMINLVDNYPRMVKNFLFKKNNDSTIDISSLNLDLRKNTISFQNRPGQPGWWNNNPFKNQPDYLFDYSLIANPFITINGNDFFVHLLVADKHEKSRVDAQKNKVYHQTIVFQQNGNYVGRDKDVTEDITNQIPIYGDETWINNHNWSSNFINANLKINRNMFNSNSLVFAYPYAAAGNPRVPLFNVVQFLINPSNGRIDWGSNNGAKKSMVLPAAKEILEYWKANNAQYGKDNSLNKIYPFPDGNHNNLNHNYNRLITVSPFDNTIVYAAKPNLTNPIFDQTNNNENKWAGFWLGTVSKSTPYRPFIVYNDSTLGQNMDPKMTTVNDLYTYGPTFDLKSLTGQSLNLYFNQTGTGRNDTYSNNGFLSSKIGLLDDVLAKDGPGNIWFRNVVNPTSGKPLDKMGSVLNSKSYSTLIHSRANLETWYPRTWQNIEVAGNLFSSNYQINASVSDSTRAVANSFNTTLNEAGFFDTNKSVDLVSNWLDKDKKAPNNYNRLLVKRPEIRVRGESIANKLPVQTTYNFANENFLTSNPWISPMDATIKDKLKFKFKQDLPTASYQILSSWKDQVRMNVIGSTTTNLNASESHTFKNPQPTWYDNHRSTSMSEQFGRVHNDVPINGKYPLRMLLRIAKPSGNLPTWVNTLDQQKLFDKYPLAKDAVAGETTFEAVLQKFADEKTKAIDLGQSADTVAVGLGNLRIEAFLDVNPSTITTNDKTIYKKGNKRIIILNNLGQRIIYEDKYTQQWRQIYDQSAINYTDFSNYGFGNTVRADVQTSWTGSIPSSSSKLTVVANSQLLQNNLLRKSDIDQKLFTFDYDKSDRTKLIITPTDPTWLRPRLLNFQRLINMTLKFEYQSNTVTNWQTLTTVTDANMKSFWPNANTTTFKIPSASVQGITKLRLRLVPNQTTDVNSFVQLNGYTDTEGKFISEAQESGVKKVDINKSWFDSVILENNAISLSQIQTSDFTTFEDKIFAKSEAIKASASLRSKVKLQYKWNAENNWYDAAGIQSLIVQRLNSFNTNDQGVFSLWNGTTGIKITAKFVKDDSNSDVEFVTSNGSSPTENDLTGFVKSTIKTAVDLSSYISQLQSTPITATTSSTPGTFQGSSIRFPNKTGAVGSAQFAGKSWDDIKSILAAVGVTPQFKQYQLSNNNWSNWINDINSVNSYDPSNPQIKIGFKSTNTNIKLLGPGSGSTIEIDNNSDYSLSLSLPKLVKLPDQTKIDKMIQDFNKQNIFSGNTYQLEVSSNLDAGKNIFINGLKEASSSGSNSAAYNNLNNYLVFKFKLGNSDWKEANELKTFLSTQITDQTSNLLKMKIELSQNNEFIFDTALTNKEFDILIDNNKIIKKYIHGTQWENALKNSGISLNAGSSKQNLSYTFKTELNDFQASGEIATKEVTLEYQLISAANNNPTWTQGNLPQSVNSDVNEIKVRIANKNSVDEANKIYTYGPQKQNNQAVLTIDLQNIPTVLSIDPNWFSETPISTNVLNDLSQLTTNIIQQWENNIWAKVNNNQGVPQDLRDKVYIKYTLEINGGGHQNLEGSTLQAALLAEQKNYANGQHHGIFKLWNSTDNKGYKIKATFAKRQGSEQKIQFQKNNQNVDNNEDARTSFVNTNNVRTTLDLTAWIANLISTPTSINTPNAGQIPAGGLVPPVLSGTPNTKLFASQTFANIDTWLKVAGVNLLWNKDPKVSSNTWTTTINTTEYDATKKKLWFAIENQSNNLILTLGNNKNTLNPGSNNKNDSIEIKLNAPAVINVRPNQLSSLTPYFSGNTKQLTVNVQEISKKLDEIKRGLGSGFENAPLTIMIQVGNEQPYDYKNVAAELLKLPDDVENGIIVAKFAIDSTAQNKDQFQIIQGGDGNQQIVNDGVIKVYINNKNTFEDLQKVVLKGNDKNLQLDWSNTKFSIDSTTGVITTVAGEAKRAVGLKIQYTFKDDLAPNGPSGADPYQTWVDAQPGTFDANRATNLNFRLQVKDPNYYVYENILDNTKQYKFIKSLADLGKTIRVDRSWLNKPLVSGTMPITNFNLSVYKTNVTNAITNPPDRSKLKIVYGFDGSTSNLSEQELQQKMREYSTTNANDKNKNFGILHLWNGQKGTKITATFAVNETIQGAQNYTLEWVGNNSTPVELNTQTVITKINLINLVSWLKTTAVAVQNKPNTNDQIASLTFKPISAAGSPFNSKSWQDTEFVLENLGIKVQYLPVYDGSSTTDWKETISEINKYNNAGKFQVRFQITRNNQSGGINVGATLGNGLSDIGGSSSSDSTSSAIDVYLDIIREIQISNEDVRRMFIQKQDAWGGNTKFFNIKESDENALIDKIKNNNHSANPNINPSYKSADLEMVYFMGENPSDKSNWQTRDSFIQSLKTATDDQTSNKVYFKFRIKPVSANTSKFKVTNNPYLLNENDNQGNKVPFFVHTNQRENKAKNVRVNGTQDQLNWSFDIFGTANTDYEITTDKKVFLKSKNRNVLRLEFSAKDNPSYNDPDATDDETKIETQWVTKYPLQININKLEKLYVRIKPIQGFIYEAAYTDVANNLKPTAAAHKVITSVQKKIIVNKTWISENDLSVNKIDISTLTQQIIEQWENKIYEKIKAKNNIDDQNARKIKIKYFFENDQQTNYDSAQALFEKIRSLITDYSNNDGILQLWNGNQRGTKIIAFYESADQNFILSAEGNNNTPTLDDLKETVKTSNIETNVSLVSYINVLKSNKTTAATDPKVPGKLLSFNPPNGNNPNGIFDRKTYDEIANRLKTIGVTIEFSKDKKTWNSKENTNEYDLKQNALYLKFSIETNTNIKLQLTNTEQIGAGQSSTNVEIKLPLNVPKYITIDPTQQYWNLTQQFNFRDNTKSINFAQNKINDFITAIKSANAAGGDTEYNNAPLEIQFQVGSNSDFKKPEELKQYLLEEANKNIDRSDRTIKFKFAIQKGQEANWILQQSNDNNGSYTLLEDSSAQNQVKIFINDGGMFEKIKKMTITGTQDNLVWNWPFGNTINATTGIITPTGTNTFGKGLKIQFSFNENASIEGNNPDQWSSKIPTTFDSKYDQVWLRIRLTDNNRYLYDHIDKKFNLSLANIQKTIRLDTNWLNLKFNNDQLLDLQNLNLAILTTYENQVKEKAKADKTNPVAPNLIDKFTINYQFDNQTDWVTKDKLIEKINQYKTNNNQVSLGILQLWNNQTGVKIKAKFVDADTNDKYSIDLINGTDFTIDNSNVITTIDFIKVLEWLKSLEVEIEESANNVITKLKIPNIKQGIEFFGSKQWTEVENALTSFGITIEYSNNINGQQEQWGPINTVNKYDPKNPSFKIRFKLDGSKSKNIKFKWANNEEMNGATAATSQSTTINIKAKLLVEIPTTLLDAFKANANITGNTKNIIINSAQTAEQNLISQIIEHNKKSDPRYAKLVGKLELQYTMTDTINGNTVWKKISEFKTYLAGINQDQTTNQIQYKIVLTDDTEFKMDANDTNAKILSPKQSSTDASLKIKYYVNAADWETKADKIEISGPSNQLVWNFNTIFNGKFEEQNNKVYLRNDAGQALQVYFTLNANADYNQPELSDDLSQIKNKWVSIKPSGIPAGTTNLKIKLVANTGYVYESAEQGATVAAKAHNIKINIQNVIYVDKSWFSAPFLTNEVEISALKKVDHFDPFENQIYEKMKIKNGITDDVARKIKIKYILENDGNNKYFAQNLIDKINQLRIDYSNNELGIIQLWNGQQGRKLNGIFESSDQKYIIRVDGNPNTPNEDQIKNQIDTNKVYTNISLVKYIQTLIQEKTQVDLDENAGEGKMKSFTPPAGKNANEIFYGKTYDEIATRLKAVGVKVEFAKDKNGPWQSKDQTKEYDIQKNALYLRFRVESTNIKLQLTSNQQIGNNQDSSAVLEIKLPLQVPKYIVIDASKSYWQLTNQFNFRGTTKEIEFDNTKIQEFIKQIKQENVNAGGDQDYANAPLDIQFQIGTGSDFVEISKLNEYLKSQNDDMSDRIVKFQFALKPDANPNEWKIKNAGEYTLLTDTATNNQIKIFINDKGVFNQLKSMNVSGTSDNLVWNWPPLVKPIINETTGILEPDKFPDQNFGKGLRFEFTFNPNYANATVGSDPAINWVSKVPKNYDANKGFTHVYLRIKLTREDYYTYENLSETISLSLENVGQKIVLKTQWLNQLLNDGNPLNLEQLTVDQIDAYENKVNEAAKADGLSETLFSKFAIKYQFNFDGNLDEQQLVDKAGLIQKIQSYQTNKNQTSLGILQLWNQAAGIKIIAKFVDADKNDKYMIETQGDPGYKELDTSKVITTIDFSKVIIWLTTTKKLIQVSGDANSAQFSIPAVNSNDDPIFNGKTWDQVTKALKLFGITTQYRHVLNLTQGQEENWVDQLNSVTKYNENIGKIQIRFKFDNQKAKNIKFKTTQTNISDGSNTAATEAFDASLDIKLIVQIKQNLVDKFTSNPNVIKGNTKYLTIDANLEKTMIDEIIADNVLNNNAFNAAQLNVKYKLQNQSSWKDLATFISSLKSSTKDETSNKVLFKFEVGNDTDFQVDNSERTLFDPAQETDPNNWKVKLFINNGTWETNASTVSVTGKTSALKWNWNDLKVNESQDGKVGTNALSIEFSAKPNANYDDPNATDDPNNLINGWTTIKPTTLDATIKNLYIRIKAKAGYIYGPAYNDNGHTKIVKAHQVTLEIKREILVNPKDLLTPLTIENITEPFVNDIKKTDIEKFIQKGLKSIPQDLQEHVTVKFNFNGKQGLDANQLFNSIQSIINGNNSPNYGVLQLWNNVQGEKIEAYYELVKPNGEYELITNDTTPPNQKQVVSTDHIKTKIKLIDIVNELKNRKIEFEPLNNKNARNIVQIKNWNMPQTKEGSEALNGLSWQTFEQRLKAVGVLIKARVVNNPDSPQDSDWKPLDQLKEYNDATLQLALRFEIDSQKGKNIILSVLAENDVNSTTQKLPEFKMNIKAPARVTVKEEFINKFKTSYKLDGNTKDIQLDQAAETELINSIFNDNIAINGVIFQELKDRLFVEYYLGKDATNFEESKWMTRDSFIKYLKQTNTDQVTNEIWFRLNVNNPTGDDVQTFNIDKKPQELYKENISVNSKVKIFINDNGLEARAKALKAIGSTEAVEIENLETFKRLMPKGLKAQWSNVANPIQDNHWTDEPPKTLNADKNLWIRFKSDDGYVYEKALKDQQDQYTQYSGKYEISTEGLKVILKVQKEWLEKIQITNNTSNPNIDESLATAEINKILPTGKPDLIELQYHIKGSSDWLKKDQFMEKLKNLKGAKDATNFILKREEIEVRYAIKNGEDEYSLSINGVNITENNQGQYYLQLVDDTKNRNEDFEGYINVDLLTEFKKDNFRIQGSTTRPQFLVTNREKIESYFAPYASDQLFDIIYSTDFNSLTGQWTWDETKSILKNGKLIGETDLIGQTTIKPDKKFALKFISKQRNKYGVYKDSKKQDDGYILDLSENVKITIEIENPFTKNNKTLGLWTRDDNKQGKYFQGEGGFKIVVANKNDFSIDSSNGTVQSAQQFLQSSSLADNEKEALEFVYHIFGANPTKDEIDRIQKTINDHQSKDWTQFNSTTKNNGDWSGDLKLKVGDYVAVAIRVKKQFSEGDNAFVLKNNDYSMILPTMPDQSGNMKKPGRISGYKVKTDAVKLDESSVTLLSMINPELPPLDGWAWLSKLNLQADEKGNYLGVDLDLQLYNQFYKKNGTDQIWISGSGAKLVKRETTSDNSDLVDTGKTYKDGSNQDIMDENGKPIKIYKTKQNRLSNPKKENNVTKNKLLENLGNGAFRLDVNQSDSIEQGKLSLFRNQDVDLKLVASQGEGTKDLPDFYLDKDNQTIQLKNIISPKIKYPIENENKITYSWNYDDFSIDSIEYDPVNNNDKPEDGAAKIKTIFKLFKQTGDSENKETITGDTTDQAIQALEESLKKDFDDQLKFQVVYSKNNGGETVEDTNNIYKFTTLKNKDRISLKIVAKDEDLYYVEAPRPLIINVNGLTEAAPTRDKLQHLRVEQNGLIDGQGSFKVLVSNPDNPGEDERAILKGWKFMIRVWDKDPNEKGEKQIKINWTDDQALIKGLSNGDKVEWKLVSEDGNPVKDAYYNTIALQHSTDPNNGKITYNFGEVNYPKGEGTYSVVNNGIGAYPEVDQYPEKSGFVISGLKDKFEIFKIDKSAFEKVLAQLQPTYVGINTQGTIRFDSKYFEQEYWVNTKGDIYTQAEKPQVFKDNLDQEIIEIKLIDFLKQVTFYTHDPVIANYQGGFKFSGNDVNINNHLTNGDQMWATFDTRSINDVNANINDPLSSLTTRLNDVSGLKDIIDPMSPLWYVLMALAGIVTLGTAALIAFLVARHKKLKGKN